MPCASTLLKMELSNLICGKINGHPLDTRLPINIQRASDSQSFTLIDGRRCGLEVQIRHSRADKERVHTNQAIGIVA